SNSRRLPGPLPASWHADPGEEGQNSARLSLFVSEVEVIGARIVKVDGQLYQAQSQQLRIEVQIPLWVARDHGHVMDSEDTRLHVYSNQVTGYRLQVTVNAGWLAVTCNLCPVT